MIFNEQNEAQSYYQAAIPCTLAMVGVLAARVLPSYRYYLSRCELPDHWVAITS